MKIAPLALVAALAWPASAKDGGSFDCSSEDGRKDFREAFSKAGDATKAYLGKRRVRSTAGDARECVIPQWCLVHKAKVKFAVDDSPGGVSTVGLLHAPPSSCSAPWSGVCESATTCVHATGALIKGQAESAAAFKKSDSGQVTVGLKALWDSGGSLGAATGGGTGWRGLSFAWKDETYRVQHKTRFIFRQTAAGLEDTGQTLPEDVLAQVCAQSGAAVKTACDAGDKSDCAGIGLSPVKGKKGRFKDARGGGWKDEKGVCSS